MRTDKVPHISPYNCHLTSVTINHNENSTNGYVFILRQPKNADRYDVPDLLLRVDMDDRQEVIFNDLDIQVSQHDRIACYFRTTGGQSRDMMVYCIFRPDVNNPGASFSESFSNTDSVIFEPWRGDYFYDLGDYQAPRDDDDDDDDD